MIAPQISRTLDPDLACTCVVFRFGTGDILVLSDLPKVDVELSPMQGGGSGRQPCRRGKTWCRSPTHLGAGSETHGESTRHPATWKRGALVSRPGSQGSTQRCSVVNSKSVWMPDSMRDHKSFWSPATWHEVPPAKGFWKMAVAFTGGNRQRSPVRMRLRPPNGRASPLPLHFQVPFVRVAWVTFFSSVDKTSSPSVEISSISRPNATVGTGRIGRAPSPVRCLGLWL